VKAAARRAAGVNRGVLLAGVSAAALLLAAPNAAQARSVLLAGGVSATATASASATVGAQQAAAVAQQSMAALARATAAIQAMQQAQSAAHALALSAPSAVPDGMVNGGLVPDSGLAAPGQSNPVTSWVNANTPTQTVSGGQTLVTIQQTGQQALLNWSSFNVGKNTTVDFDQQGNTTWVALNKINDPSGVPSQILGSIRADGSVYIINRNGVIFGGSSQVNVNTLIASSLDLNDTYATNTATSNFLIGNGIPLSGSTPTFQSVDSNGTAYSAGAVTVQAGAQINAPGGDVLLLGQSVTNNGAISTPAGQTLLLGGSDVTLRTGDTDVRGFVVGASSTIDPNLPPVFQIAQSPGYFSSTTPGTVVNNGSISAPQGNVTIVAGQVTQNGVLTSTTSTTANGTVIIRAETGNLVLGGPNDDPLYAQYGVGGQTIGNLLDPNLPDGGASLTIETGLGSILTQPDYAAFTTQFVNPATASANQYAEPLQLFDASGVAIGSGAEAYAYLQSLSPAAQNVLLNRIFFELVRDSGREHTGAAGGGNFERGTGTDTIDTVGALNSAFSSYQRAYAAIGTFLNGVSGSGDFLGGLSTVRTLDGGNITIISPQGQIQVGLVSTPANFPGYAIPGNGTWAFNFGIVTEKGGDIDLYANDNISVDQSRIFTLEGGDITAISRVGNVDAGKGAKTVQAIQPPSVAFDGYGDITITPYGPASGSGIATLRSLPGVPLGNADLIAFEGIVNAGDAGIRVSGNLNVAAVQVLNAGNIQAQGTETGVPTAVAPNIGALSTASNVAGQAAAAATDSANQARRSNPVQDLPSIITVEVIGYGGDSGTPPRNGGSEDRERGKDRKKSGAQSSNEPGDTLGGLSPYRTRSAVQVLGSGALTSEETQYLTEAERQRLSQP
jgi:filamentous hemagglutinin family protein